MFFQKERTIIQQTDMMSILHKILIGLSLLFGFVLVAVLNNKKFNLDAKRNGLLLEIIGNVSHGLDKLDTGLETMMTDTKIAKERLHQLVALNRESLIACASRLREKRSVRATNPSRIDSTIHTEIRDESNRRDT